MFLKLTISFVFVWSQLALVTAYETGAPDEACKTMAPKHLSYKDNSTFPPQTTPSPFVVVFSSYNTTSSNVTNSVSSNSSLPINGNTTVCFSSIAI